MSLLLCALVLVTLYLLLDIKQREVPKPNINVEFFFGAEDTILHSAMEDFFRKAVEYTNTDIDVRFSYAYTDHLLQASQIRDGIMRNPNVIVIMPQDSSKIVASIDEVQKAGIPVVMYNRPSDPTSSIQPTAYVGLDTFNQAYTTSIALFKLMREDGIEPRVINLMGKTTDRNAILRRNGLYNAAEEMGVAILGDIETDWDSQIARDNLIADYAFYDAPNAFFCASDWILPGVEQAMRELDLWYPYGDPRHLYFGSQDVYPRGFTLIKEGYIDVNTAFDLFPMSMILLQVILMTANEQTLDQNSYLIPGRIVTMNNIESLKELWALHYL